jgi:hypothetical protein
MKLCKDCKYHFALNVDFGDTDFCSHPEQLEPPDVVTGDRLKRRCRFLRAAPGSDRCGPEAKFWEDRWERK